MEFKYSTHRSLQRAVLENLDADFAKRQQTFNQAVALLRYHLPRPSPFMVPMYSQWPAYEPLIPHVTNLHQVFTKSVPPIEGTLEFAELLCNAGTYLFEKGLGKLGLPILETAENICVTYTELPQSVTKSAVDVLFSEPGGVAAGSVTYLAASDLASLEANILAYAAGIHWTTGGLSTREQAHLWTHKVLELRELHISQTLPEQLTIYDHLLLSNCYNDLAIQFLDEEEYLAAEPWLHKSLEIKERFRAQGEHIPQFEFAESTKSLSFVRLALGETQEAMELAEKAATSISEEEGPDSASTQTFRFFWAVILYGAGEMQKALTLHEDVFKQRLRLLGELSHSTHHSSFAVGQIQYKLGQFTTAALVYKVFHRIVSVVLTCTGNPSASASSMARKRSGRWNAFSAGPTNYP